MNFDIMNTNNGPECTIERFDCAANCLVLFEFTL